MAGNGLFWRFRRNRDIMKEYSVSVECCELFNNANYAMFVIECCKNLISNLFTGVNFRVYESNELSENDIFYKLNVSPNINDNAAAFWKKAVYKMLSCNDALIVSIDQQMLLADSYEENIGVVNPSIYTVVFNDLKYDFTRNSTEVIKLKNNNINISALTLKVTAELERMLTASYESFIKDRTTRGIVKVPAPWMQTTEGQENIKKLMQERFAPWYNATTQTVMPLSNQMEYTENFGGTQPKRDSGNESKSLFNDICQTVAMAFNVPLNVLLGNTADMDSNTATLLTLCVNPIAKQIEGEINRTLFTKAQYKGGSRVEVDLSNVKVTSITEQAANMDVLFRMGYSVNDILRSIGKTEIPEGWASAHYVTKNYERVSDNGEVNSTNADN